MLESDVLKILVVEDNDDRIAGLQRWAKTAKRRSGCEFQIVWTKAAGSAIGLLKRDRGRVYAGIMLDHDLYQQKLTLVDDLFNGKDVVDAVIEYVDKDVPIFVHSANTTEGPKMAKKLIGAGFAVEKRAYLNIRFEQYLDWLRYCCECAQE